MERRENEENEDTNRVSTQNTYHSYDPSFHLLNPMLHRSKLRIFNLKNSYKLNPLNRSPLEIFYWIKITLSFSIVIN